MTIERIAKVRCSHCAGRGRREYEDVPCATCWGTGSRFHGLWTEDCGCGGADLMGVHIKIHEGACTGFVLIDHDRTDALLRVAAEIGVTKMVLYKSTTIKGLMCVNFNNSQWPEGEGDTWLDAVASACANALGISDG